MCVHHVLNCTVFMAAFGKHGPALVLLLELHLTGSIETPWLDGMSSPPRPSHRRHVSSPTTARDPAPTIAAFSPSATHSPLVTGTQRSTILVHQKSPLLVATPPQITRALAYSHPFILPLNSFVGLLSWTTDDPWESFLLVAAFWASMLYGDLVIRWTGPLFVVMLLISAMYARRYSPLSSTGWTGEKRKPGHKRGVSETNVAHQKSLDEIVETLRLFTSRCNILLDPFLRLTDFLSTQSTATSATTKPALTALFLRIVLITPIWILFTVRPLRIVTTRRLILAVGTTILTWHSQPARVTRTIFWRSRTARRICTVVTGLDFSDPAEISTQAAGSPTALTVKGKNPHDIAASLAAKRSPDSPAIRFTFTIYENQRRWLGIGWTSSMLAYERASWTDEHLNTTAPRDKFELPEVEGGRAKWIWVEGSEWQIEGGDATADQPDSEPDGGWIFYDNKVCHQPGLSEWFKRSSVLTILQVARRAQRQRWLGPLHPSPEVVSCS
jgi:Integral peroxisomal membrane peroxin